MIDQAPIVKVTVRDDLVTEASMYAPGLPDGEHDLYCEPDPRVQELERVIRQAIDGHTVWESVYGSSPMSRAHLAMLEAALTSSDQHPGGDV